MSKSHEKIEKNVGLMAVLIAVAVSFGGLAEIVPLMYQAEAIEPLPGVKPYPALAAGRARRLRPRGLLQLPLADGAHAALRDRALRPLLAGRRIGVRPPVPVGQQAHRAGPRARRRPLFGRLAPRAPGQPARRGARVQHAGFPWLATNVVDGAQVARRMRALRTLGDPYSGCRDRRRPRGRPARPNSMPWSPTCRVWGSTPRRETDTHAFRNHHRHPAAAVHRRLGLGLEPEAQARVRRGRAACRSRTPTPPGAAAMTAGWSMVRHRARGAQHHRLRVAAVVDGPAPPGDSAPDQTSHVWDGDITEYNKPLPRWWINLFYLTIVFSLGYLAWYPGAGSFAGSRAGRRRPSTRATRRRATQARCHVRAFRGTSRSPLLAATPQALTLGKSIFGNTARPATAPAAAARPATRTSPTRSGTGVARRSRCCRPCSTAAGPRCPSGAPR
jgi:hypothetical protein